MQPKVLDVKVTATPADSDMSWVGEYTDTWQPGAIDRTQGRGGNHREYRYFVPANSMEEHRRGLRKLGYGKHEAWVLARSYVRQDYARMEALCRGEWCYLGIQATATVGVATATTPDGVLLTQRLTSGGICGVESDANQGYQGELVRDELADLHGVLEAFGVDLTRWAELTADVELVAA